MARLRTGQKVDRVIKLLMGLRHRRIASTLAQHGFTQEDLDTGWELLRGVVGKRLDVSPVKDPDPRALQDLDAWENKWFPIARVSLAHRYPAVHDEVFLNLSQTSGAEVVISVGMFIKRLATLESGDSAAVRVQARQLLTRRGLTPGIIADAESLIGRLSTVEEPALVDLAEIRAARDRAEEMMWVWYLEWSTIARTAIRDGRLLRILGFGRRPRSGDDTDADADEGTDEPGWHRGAHVPATEEPEPE